MVRLAERNGFADVSDFGDRKRISFLYGRRGLRNDELAPLGRTTPEALAAWTPTEVPGRKVQLRGQVLRMPWDWLHPVPGSRVRGCPSCLRADAEREAEGRGGPFIRAWWCVKDVMHCHVHGTLLVEVPHTVAGDREPGSYWARLRDAETHAVPDADRRADLYLLGRLGLAPAIPAPGVDDLEFGEASAVLSWLGELAVADGEPMDVRSLDPAEAMRVRSAGLSLAESWPDRIMLRLDELVEARTSRRSGPKAMYGRFYSRLYDDRMGRQDHEGRNLLRAVVAEHAMRHVPFGPADTLFGEPTDKSERVTLAHTEVIAGLPRESFLTHARWFGFELDPVEAGRRGVARSVAEAVRDKRHA